MQTYSRGGVRQERTGWRDQEISNRHRAWGFDCPAVDLDFLMVEYNLGLPVALCEYKHHQARMPNLSHPTYRALINLGDGYKEPLPVFMAFYWPGVWAMRVYPLNDAARSVFEMAEILTEREFVMRLYRLRRLVLARELSDRLHDDLPPLD